MYLYLIYFDVSICCNIFETNRLDDIRSSLIPMTGRLMHDVSGHTTFQPYGTGQQAIYSVSRADLNRLLLDKVNENHLLPFAPSVESEQFSHVFVFCSMYICLCLA